MNSDKAIKLQSSFNIDKIEVNPEDVFIIKFPLGEYSQQTLAEVYRAFKHSFCENTCIFMPDDMNIQIYSKRNCGTCCGCRTGNV